LKIEVNIDPACTEEKVVIHASQMTSEIEALIRSLSAPEPDVIPVQTGRGIELIPPEKLIRIYTEKQKIYAQTADGIYPLRFRLYEMEEKLKSRAFVRISSSELVNSKMITGMDFSLTGTIRISLRGGITTYVSRRHVSEVKKLFGV